jgi:hypothetical protein
VLKVVSKVVAHPRLQHQPHAERTGLNACVSVCSYRSQRARSESVRYRK